jgi:ABC-type glycerol-3-phosphate transport system permease component
LTNPILATPEPTVTAGLLLSTVPNLLLFALFNRQLTHGITAGAVK